MQKQWWIILIVLGAVMAFVGLYGYGQILLWFGAAVLLAGVVGLLASRGRSRA